MVFKMANKMIWDEKQKKMIPVGGGEKGEVIKVSIPEDLAEILKGFAKEDGYDFTGISYVTEKDAEGKTKKDKDGKPIFKKDKDGKPVTVKVEVSTAKVNSAISQYTIIAVKKLIDERNEVNES